MTKISIVVLHYKDINLTNDCLMSLDKLEVSDLDVDIIVINSSSDEITYQPKKIKTVNINVGENLGYAGGNNVGIKRALNEGADFIWILNNDTIVDPNCLTYLSESVKDTNEIGAASPKIFFAPGYEFHKDRYTKKDLGKVIWWAGGEIDWNNVQTVHRGLDKVDSGQDDGRAKSVETITGTAMLISRLVFEKIGLFDEKYFLYFEESDFCQKLSRAGYQLLYVPKAVVWHKNAGSSGAGSELHDYYLARNRLLFGMRYAPWKAKYSLLKQGIKLLFTGRTWQKKGVRDFFMGKFGVGSFSPNHNSARMKGMITAVLFVFWPEEEDLVETCLETIKWCDEIIVINGGATAETISKVKKYTNKIYEDHGKDFGKRHNLAKEKASGDWIFYIDADERISKNLKEQILEAVKTDRYSAYQVNRVNYFLGAETRYGDRFPDYIARLFKKDRMIGWTGKIHESAKVNGQMGRLDGVLYHLTHRDIYSMLAKTINFSEHEAVLRLEANHPPVVWWRLIRVIFSESCVRIIKYQGWRAGTRGWIDGLFQALSLFVVYARLWELQQKPSLLQKYRDLDQKILEECS